MIKNSLAKLTIIFAPLLLGFVFPLSTYAHILASDNNIGAVLHIDPEDDPIARQQSGFFFDIKDKDNKFSAQNCDCRVDIYENGKVIFSNPVTNDKNSDINSVSFFYTFPQKDVYQVKLTGSSLTPDSFQPFVLSWDIRVDREDTGQNPSQNTSNFFVTHIAHFLGGGIIISFLLVYLVYQLFQKNRSKNRTKGSHDKKDQHVRY